MAREFPLWVIVLLPWIGALSCLFAARPGVRVFGPRRAGGLGHYLGLGATALALLFTIQAVQHLLAPEDPRALGHTPMTELLGPVIIGELRVDSTLIADRLSTCAALLICGAMLLARMFVPGPAGQRDLFGEGGGAPEGLEPGAVATQAALYRLALLGLLEGAALLFVLASDLGLAALGWALLGVGAAIVVARGVGDERRASAATRVLALGISGDIALGGGLVVLVLSGVGLAHNNMWAPLTGEYLYAAALGDMTFGDVIALLFLGAALLRLASLSWAGNSLAEALLDAVLIPVPALYLLLRYQRVLSYAPSVLAGLLVFGMLLALLAAAVALVRPRGQAHQRARPGGELGLAGTGLAWAGLVAMVLGVGAWRTAALLLLAQALGRLGLRLALLVAAGDQLPPWSAQVGRVLCWCVAGIIPGLGFVVLTQSLVGVLTRTSLLAPWMSWPAAIVVLLVAFMHAASVARIWYEDLGRKPGAGLEENLEEDGLDFGPLLIFVVGMVVLGVMGFAAWFGVVESPLAWLDLVLPLAGGHESASTGIRAQFRDGAEVARPWIAGGAASVALVTSFAWMWTRERFRRAHGGELAGLSGTLELLLGPAQRVIRGGALALTGLTELAARGVGRGLFEAGPRVLASLAHDFRASLLPRLRGLSLGGARLALIGLLTGFTFLLGWLYAKPKVSSLLPSEDYGFGGLRTRLIRAGGHDDSPPPTRPRPLENPAPSPSAAPSEPPR
jgi:hypothetical protein